MCVDSSADISFTALMSKFIYLLWWAGCFSNFLKPMGNKKGIKKTNFFKVLFLLPKLFYTE